MVSVPGIGLHNFETSKFAGIINPQLSKQNPTQFENKDLSDNVLFRTARAKWLARERCSNGRNHTYLAALKVYAVRQD